MIFASSYAIRAVATFLAAALDEKENPVRQRLRESCWEAEAKAGTKRQEIVVDRCVVPLLRWILSRWHGKHRALELDATTLRDRFAGLRDPHRLDDLSGRRKTRLAAGVAADAPSAAPGRLADLDRPGPGRSLPACALGG